MNHRASLVCGAALAAMVGSPAWSLPVLATTPPIVNPGGGQPVINTLPPNLVTVDLNAQRTIIDWSSYNVGPGEAVSYAFGQRNWIAVNRVASGAININGQISAAQSAGFPLAPGAVAGGNIWFYSPDGVIFGPNARVNAGGMLATSAAPDVNAFLNAANINIPFVGSGAGGPVTVASGASFTGTALMAFVAPRVSTAAGSSMTVGDAGTTLYGAADSFELQFFPVQNNDLTLFTFIVPSGAAGTPVGVDALSIAGTTTSGTIYLAAYSRAQLAGQLINAPGLLTARSSIVEYGQVTVTTGRTILLGQVGFNSEAQQVAGVTTGSARLGEINADGNVNIHLAGTGGVGDLTATRIRSGQAFGIVANNITIGAGGLVSGDGANPAIGARRNLFIDSGGIVDVPFIDARGLLTITRGAAQAGRTVSLNTLRLGTVTSGGNMLLNGSSSIDAGAVTAGGEAQLFGSLPVRLASLTTNGYTRVSSSQTIAVAGQVRGVDIDLRSAQGVSASSLVGANSVMVGTGGPAIIGTITGPSLLMDSSDARLGTVNISGDARLRVTQLRIGASLNAANLTLEHQLGAFTLGGNTPAPGVLTNADFQRIRVSGAVSIYAGVVAPTVNVPTPVYGDLTVREIDVDPAKVPRLNLYAHNSRDLLFFGPIQPTVAGGVVRIGDPAADSVWAPRAIKLMDPSDPVTLADLEDPGEIRTFDRVELYARNDILIGSQRFVELVAGTPADQIDLARGLPLGVAPTADELGRIYLVAGSVALSARDRILQQNTGGPGEELGIFLTGRGVAPTEPLLTIGGAALTDIFVAFPGPDGLVFGQQAAVSNRIARLSGDTSQGAILVNGCALGVGCQLSTPSTEFRIEAFRPAAIRPAIDPPIFSPPPPVDDEEDEAEAIVTGTGNEEIWRRDQ